MANSIEALLTRANVGEPAAQYELAYRFQTGDGMMDRGAASRWSSLAAGNGSVEA